MRITFDQVKRDWTFETRGLAFEDAAEVFVGRRLEWLDERRDYGEPRWITVGKLEERMVVVVWTPREDARHVISMRKANVREQTRYRKRLEEAGPARAY
jgi:uncharacterized protein